MVEVESLRGGKLRLELKGIATSQLAELIRAFAASQGMLAIATQNRAMGNVPPARLDAHPASPRYELIPF